jgi:hypothetical protein
LVILCGAPSYGVGKENEIATQAGVPAIRLVNSQVSRMMLGSFAKSFDIQYTGSLKEGIFFDEEEFAKALRAVRKLHKDPKSPLYDGFLLIGRAATHGYIRLQLGPGHLTLGPMNPSPFEP